jgi:hypothetical protein
MVLILQRYRVKGWILKNIQKYAVYKKLTSVVKIHSERMENDIPNKWNLNASKSGYMYILQNKLRDKWSNK